MSWSEEVKKVSQSCLTLWDLLDCSLPGLLCPWNSPGQNIGMGSHTLLQRIFPSQGLNPGLPHYRRILYHLSHQESPRKQEWVSYPFYSRSFQPRNLTRVSCAAGGFFTSWVTREAQEYWSGLPVPSPEDLPIPGIEPRAPALPVDSLPAEPPGSPWWSPASTRKFSPAPWS